MDNAGGIKNDIVATEAIWRIPPPKKKKNVLKALLFLVGIPFLDSYQKQIKS